MTVQKRNNGKITVFHVLALLGLCVVAAAIIFPMFISTGHTGMDRCHRNMDQIHMAIMVYAETSGYFPQKGWDKTNSRPIWLTAVLNHLPQEDHTAFQRYLKCPLNNTHEITSYDISTAIAGKPWDKGLIDKGDKIPIVIEIPHPSGSRSVCYCSGRTEYIIAGKKYPD